MARDSGTLAKENKLMKITIEVPDEIKRQFLERCRSHGSNMTRELNRYIERKVAAAKELSVLDVLCQAVEWDGMALRRIPVEHRTVDICRKALKSNRAAIVFVPDAVEKLLKSEEKE